MQLEKTDFGLLHARCPPLDIYDFLYENMGLILIFNSQYFKDHCLALLNFLIKNLDHSNFSFKIYLKNVNHFRNHFIVKLVDKNMCVCNMYALEQIVIKLCCFLVSCGYVCKDKPESMVCCLCYIGFAFVVHK